MQDYYYADAKYIEDPRVSDDLKEKETVFKVDQIIRIVHPFSSDIDGEGQRALTQDTYCVIKNIDRHRGLQVNDVSNSWSECIWIQPENFKNIEILPRLTYKVGDVVEMKQNWQTTWRSGWVTSTNPLKIRCCLGNFQESQVWENVRPRLHSVWPRMRPKKYLNVYSIEGNGKTRTRRLRSYNVLLVKKVLENNDWIIEIVNPGDQSKEQNKEHYCIKSKDVNRDRLVYTDTFRVHDIIIAIKDFYADNDFKKTIHASEALIVQYVNYDGTIIVISRDYLWRGCRTIFPKNFIHLKLWTQELYDKIILNA